MRRSRNRRGIGLGFVSSALAALFVVVPLPAAVAPGFVSLVPLPA